MRSSSARHYYKRCFNPCFNGYSTLTLASNIGTSEYGDVSILVLMDTLL